MGWLIYCYILKNVDFERFQNDLLICRIFIVDLILVLILVLVVGIGKSLKGQG